MKKTHMYHMMFPWMKSHDTYVANHLIRGFSIPNSKGRTRLKNKILKNKKKTLFDKDNDRV